jgi:hypothetical protein
VFAFPLKGSIFGSATANLTDMTVGPPLKMLSFPSLKVTCDATVDSPVAYFEMVLEIVSRTLFRHLAPPVNQHWGCQQCYNTLTLHSAPPQENRLVAAGLEPARQQSASSCQDYLVCQFQHATTFLRGSRLVKTLLPLTLNYLRVVKGYQNKVYSKQAITFDMEAKECQFVLTA